MSSRPAGGDAPAHGERSAPRRPRVGLFGGTFDPPHRGHVSVARDVADALGLERVIWMPAGAPPHKDGVVVTPAEDRVAMVRAAVDADPRFVVSTREVDRAGRSYTVDTVRELVRELGEAELFVLVGVDQFRTFDDWRDPDGILSRAKLAVMDRDGEKSQGVVVRAAERAGENSVVHVPVGRVDISSTELRGALRGRAADDGALPIGVRAVIEERGLYRPLRP